MKDDVKISAKAKEISNDKTLKQNEELLQAKKKKEEVKAKAQSIKQENIEKSEKAKIETKKDDIDTSETLKEASVLVASGLKALQNKKKGFYSGILIGIVIGMVLSFALTSTLKQSLFAPIDKAKDDFDQLLTENFAGYTAIDFTNAILGEASQHQELIVMEQPLSIETTITKSGLGGLEIFSKTKDITYTGVGVYTVDLKDIDEKHVSLNEEDKIITIKINHASLQYINIDYDKIQFEDTEKGLLSFGDITLTLEQQNTLEKSIQESMRQELLKDSLLKQADEFANMKTWEIFQPIVSSLSSEYLVEIEFN